MTAYLYTSFGFVFAYSYFTNYTYNERVRNTCMYCLILLLYGIYLFKIDNNVVMKKEQDYNGVVIARERDLYSQNRLKGRVCFVTGANRGIGECIAKSFARLGATVIMGCRDTEKGEATKRKIANETKNSNIAVIKLDMEDENSVAHCFAWIKQAYKHIDISVLNAGTCAHERIRKKGVMSKNHTINYIGNVTVLKHMLPLMNTEMSKIINISTIAIFARHMHPEQLFVQGDFRRRNSHILYADSKYMFLKHINEISSDESITINSFHPGIVMTEGQLLTKRLPKCIVLLLQKMRIVVTKQDVSDAIASFCSNNKYQGINKKFFNVRIEETVDF